MKHQVTRRMLLHAGAIATSLPLLPAWSQERRFEPQVGAWRTFELTTTVNVADVNGATRLWLPMPDVDTPYQQSVDNNWSGNAAAVRVAADSARGVRMLYAEFPDSVKAPTLELTNRVRTRSRVVDWSRADAPAEDPALLRASLAPPSCCRWTASFARPPLRPPKAPGPTSTRHGPSTSGWWPTHTASPRCAAAAAGTSTGWPTTPATTSRCQAARSSARCRS